MRKIVGISLIIFLIAVIFILAKGLLSNKNQNLNSKVNTTTSVNHQAGLRLTKDEIFQHKSTDNCWIIIDNKVYDVTQYLKSGSHPGGNMPISKYCGQDATNAFETKDKPRPQPHSQTAISILENFYIGDLSN